MGNITGPVSVAENFNDCINRSDVEGLTALMTPDHKFTDTVDATVEGREANRDMWERFFELYPGYRNIFEKVTADGCIIIMEGYSICEDEVLNNIRAVWTAVIQGDKVKEWRVRHIR